MTPEVPTYRQLGSSLRAYVEAGRQLCEKQGWGPVDGSPAAATMDAAASDLLERTCHEADAHGITLLASGLEHARYTAAVISAQQPFTPHTIGRTAAEHLLRATWFLDEEVDERTRAVRRLNEWLYAIAEARYQRIGIQKAGHPGAESLPDIAMEFRKVAERAVAIGMSTTTSVKKPKVVGTDGRPGTMWLAEHYLARGGDGAGVPEFLFRNGSAVMHGAETGLLASTGESAAPASALIGRPTIMRADNLAFSLMAVPLASHNALRAVVRRLGGQTRRRCVSATSSPSA